jgi:hypothetical protein
MPTAKRETALAAFVAQLAAGLGATWTVVRDRDAPFSADKQISVDEGASALEARAPAQDRYDLALEVVAYRSGLTDETLGLTVSATHAEVVRATLSDASLGGAVSHARQLGLDDPDVDRGAGRALSVAVSIRFELLLFTRAGDPAQ